MDTERSGLHGKRIFQHHHDKFILTW